MADPGSRNVHLFLWIVGETRRRELEDRRRRPSELPGAGTSGGGSLNPSLSLDAGFVTEWQPAASGGSGSRPLDPGGHG
jgi:hypothetical protein